MLVAEHLYTQGTKKIAKIILVLHAKNTSIQFFAITIAGSVKMERCLVKTIISIANILMQGTTDEQA